VAGDADGPAGAGQIGCRIVARSLLEGARIGPLDHRVLGVDRRDPDLTDALALTGFGGELAGEPGGVAP
jgi:hypothetical protein